MRSLVHFLPSRLSVVLNTPLFDTASTNDVHHNMLPISSSISPQVLS